MIITIELDQIYHYAQFVIQLVKTAQLKKKTYMNILEPITKVK